MRKIPFQHSATGLAGFEPANAGVKVLCLTAWRHPYIRFYRPYNRRSLSSLLLNDIKFASLSDWQIFKGEWWGSNPRHPEPQSGALPLNYILHNTTNKIKARLKGFEPLAHGLEGRCSIRLSYRRTVLLPQRCGDPADEY